jgi:hypothetical protein
MIEQSLLQYGVFGLWTISNLLLIKHLIVKIDKSDLRENQQQEKLMEVIERNTQILSVVKSKI